MQLSLVVRGGWVPGHPWTPRSTGVPAACAKGPSTGRAGQVHSCEQVKGFILLSFISYIASCMNNCKPAFALPWAGREPVLLSVYCGHLRLFVTPATRDCCVSSGYTVRGKLTRKGLPVLSAASAALPASPPLVGLPAECTLVTT